MTRSPKASAGIVTLAASLTAFAIAAGAEPAPAPAPVEAPLPEGRLAPAASTDDMTMDRFLDRLMLAESGGRDNVANPRSTAVGPFQFVVATFLGLTQKHFAAETAALTPEQVLALRTNRPFARKVAEAYTRENAARLVAAGVATTWPHLRLAFFAGAEGAIRVISAKPQTPVVSLLGAAVATANPFLVGMTAQDLIDRSARDLRQTATSTAGLAVPPGSIGGKPKPNAIPVQCDLSLPSCRRWLALAERRQLRKIAGMRKQVRTP